MIIQAKKVRITADAHQAVIEILSLLDPENAAKVTFVTNPATDVGDYIIEFDEPEIFDQVCFPKQAWAKMEFSDSTVLVDAEQRPVIL